LTPSAPNSIAIFESQFVISTASESGETIWKVDVRLSQSLLALLSQLEKLEWFQGFEQLVFYEPGVFVNRLDSIFVKNVVLEVGRLKLRYQCQPPTFPFLLVWRVQWTLLSDTPCAHQPFDAQVAIYGHLMVVLFVPLVTSSI